ncbi:hypothetical protein F7725_014220 [Dissostichus mawsoni]|uniref:Carbonic anhydrase n=1 Tax=Dissostichus mawsoni TaxID=36200 RepID=A0A7J5YVB2_DISMA|nr:hypothetical protein F7725_014220 [Dissostichus mawsoni]
MCVTSVYALTHPLSSVKFKLDDDAHSQFEERSNYAAGHEKSEGIAAMAHTENGDPSPAWSSLTSYLTNVIETNVITEHNISIDDLIKDVDLTKFYRYMGSLTTPNCNEAVVWTVFHEPINIHKTLIQKFPEKAGFRNVYRPTQALNGRQVLASPATPLPSHPWCYHDHCEYTQSEWSRLPNAYCAGESQSPINIAKSSAVKEEKLGAFHFEKFDDKHVIEKIINTGHTVKCVLKEGVEVSGGGLGHGFSTLQLHFHWGAHDSEGSEHTVDSKRYPMEMHIVNKRKDLTLQKALQTTDGLAVLGFFIEATSAKEKSRSSSEQGASSSDMDAWTKLTSYLSAIKNISSEVNVTEEISIDDLLGSVNRESYYRYNGSLTTPSCNQAVVWTVFKEVFTAGPSTPRQPQPEPPSPSHCCSHELAFIPRYCMRPRPSVHCATGTGDTQWPTLFPSYCAGSRQSPIDIVSASATADSNLTAFTFTNYDSSSALKEIKNTGKTDFRRGYVRSLRQPAVHLHWGNGSSVPGSEHTVNGKRYPMEPSVRNVPLKSHFKLFLSLSLSLSLSQLHIVNSKATYNGDTALAVKDSTGLAALGFFIEEMSGNAIGQPAKWNVLSSYLSEIVTSGQSYAVPSGISLDDLLKGVDRSKYYRYLGSLTTPTCNEAVVWTVFKDTIKVSKDVIDRFSTTVRIADDSSALMSKSSEASSQRNLSQPSPPAPLRILSGANGPENDEDPFKSQLHSFGMRGVEVTGGAGHLSQSTAMDLDMTTSWFSPPFFSTQ